MLTEDVLRIFTEKKEEYLREMSSDKSPIGILLGGQGAVGKGRLNLWAERLYPENVFLAINGDNMEKSVGRLCLFDCFAKNMIADYQLLDGRWSSETLPSTIILATREKQMEDQEGIETLLNEASIALANTQNEKIKEQMKKAYDGLSAKSLSRQHPLS